MTCWAITWEDTTNVGGWLSHPEVEEFAQDGGWLCVNVGWVSYEDDECVVLSARKAEDAEQWGLSERIPKRSILSRVVIRADPS